MNDLVVWVVSESIAFCLHLWMLEHVFNELNCCCYYTYISYCGVQAGRLLPEVCECWHRPLCMVSSFVCMWIVCWCGLLYLCFIPLRQGSSLSLELAYQPSASAGQWLLPWPHVKARGSSSHYTASTPPHWTGWKVFMYVYCWGTFSLEPLYAFLLSFDI